MSKLIEGGSAFMDPSGVGRSLECSRISRYLMWVLDDAMLLSDRGVLSGARPARVGIFAHISLSLGGSQSAARLSEHYSVDGIDIRKGYSLAGLAAVFGYDSNRATERIVPDSLGSFSCLD